MNYTEILSECRLVSIYLGNECNFDCTYCDRSYISEEIGGQGMPHSSVKHIVNFFEQIYRDSSLNIRLIAFHGGEPFLYVKRMDQILDNIKGYLDQYDLKLLITTNGSLLVKNKWFLEKWAKYLNINFSYDFIYQEENRSAVDIRSIGQTCKDLGIQLVWQFVMPLTDGKMFSEELVSDIVQKSQLANVEKINLIPLRHHRGAQKFQDFFDDIDLEKLHTDLVSFIIQLYNNKINVVVDGCEEYIDKNYTGKHYKAILSPDGNMYTEYDFCEYKRTEFSIGTWMSKIIQGFSPNFYPIDNSKEDSLINEKCLNCSERAECGIKYLYKMFDVPPKETCVEFYKVLTSAIKYAIAQRGLHLPQNVFFNNRRKFVVEAADLKSFFVHEDNIIPVKEELVFSMLRRYNCFAGCHVCYVDKLFEKDKTKFSRFIPDVIPQELSDRWINLTTAYKTSTTIDDLLFLKQKHPSLFNWYRDHFSIFQSASITDNAFVRTYDILMNEVECPKGINEITFSDAWISKVNIDKIFEKLKKLDRRSKILKIKFVITDPDAMHWDVTEKMRAFTTAHDIHFHVQSDIVNLETIDLKDRDQIFSYAAYNGRVYTICSEADYLQYDSFFLTLPDTISPTSVPYDVLDDEFTFTRHISRHLQGKKVVYNEYAKTLCKSDNPYNQRYSEYFKFVGEELVVNEDYNFLPYLSVTPFDHLHRRLRSEGWVDTKFGLFRPGTPNVVPLFRFNRDQK